MLKYSVTVPIDKVLAPIEAGLLVPTAFLRKMVMLYIMDDTRLPRVAVVGVEPSTVTRCVI